MDRGCADAWVVGGCVVVGESFEGGGEAGGAEAAMAGGKVRGGGGFQCAILFIPASLAMAR